MLLANIIRVSFNNSFNIYLIIKMILNKYTSKRKLGKGAYGEVLLV